MKDLEEYYHAELAEYSVADQINDEPDILW